MWCMLLRQVRTRSIIPADEPAKPKPAPAIPPPRPPAIPPPQPPPGAPPTDAEEPQAVEPVDKEAAVKAFKEAMEEAGTTPFSLFERQAKKCEGDPRFEAIVSLKERKAIFEEFCRELAARKAAEKKGQAGKHKVRCFVYGNAVAQAVPQVGVVKGDIRKVVAQAPAKPLDADAAFLELLREIGVHGESRWSHTKPKIDRDARYKVVVCSLTSVLSFVVHIYSQALGSSAAERLFRRHVDELWQAHTKAEASRAAKEQEVGAVDVVLHRRMCFDVYPWVCMPCSRVDLCSIKQRHVEVYVILNVSLCNTQCTHHRQSRRQLEATQEEARKRQQRAAHDAAVAACRTLLGELIKEPDAVWDDWEGRLLRDPQACVHYVLHVCTWHVLYCWH